MPTKLVINLTKDQAQDLVRDLGAPKQSRCQSFHPVDLLAAMLGALIQRLLAWLTHLVRGLAERLFTNERAKRLGQEYIWLRLYHGWRKSVKH